MRRDWFSFVDPERVRAEMQAGPQDLTELSPGVWGYPRLGVVCIGDAEHMRKVQAKRFGDRFRAEPCPKGYWDNCPPLPSVAERLEALK